MGPQSKDRARTSPAITCIKILLHIFNFLYMVIGIAILAVGIATQYELKYYLELGDLYYINSAYILIAVGALILLVAIGGFYCTAKDKIAPLYMYGVFITLLAIIQVGGGIACGVFAGELDSQLKSGLNKSIHNHTGNMDYWNNVQQTLKCCGVDEPNDWITLGKDNNLPNSCYKGNHPGSTTKAPTNPTTKTAKTTPKPTTKPTTTPTPIPGNSTDDNNTTTANPGPTTTSQSLDTAPTGSAAGRRKRAADIGDDGQFEDGCYVTIRDTIKQYLGVIIGVSVGFVVLQVVGAILACCLAKKTSKNNYEQIY